MRGIIAMAAISATLLFNGCASGPITKVRTPLDVGMISKSDVFVIKPADGRNTVFMGDWSDDPESVAAGRETIHKSYADKVVWGLREAGFDADLAPKSGAVPADKLVVELAVKTFEAGADAARVVASRVSQSGIGLGMAFKNAGSSYLITDIKLLRGTKLLADITLTAPSTEWSGFAGIAGWLAVHLDSSAELLGRYLSERAK